MKIKTDNRPIMVTVRCIAYNQELYIRKCLEGFVMQKTNFRFEAIVHDDASTDGTAEIIREYAEKYPDIIIPVIETENQYSKHDGSLDRIMDSYIHGKYVALCEGDDYWIDPLKLQKQVDFLESHPDYGLVHTNRYNIKGDKLTKVKARENYDAISVLLRTGIATLTSCFRADLYFKYLEEVQPQNKGWLMGDSPMWKYMAFRSKIHLLPDYTAVYRILPESSSHSKDLNKRLAFEKSILDVEEYMLNKFVEKDNQESLLRQLKSTYYVRSLTIYLDMGHKKKALTFLKEHWKEINKKNVFTLVMINKFLS